MAPKEQDMNEQRWCDTGRQRCPTPYLCGTGCYFNETECTNLNAGRPFWDASPPGYYEKIDSAGTVTQLLVVIAAVFVCIGVAAVLVWGLI